MISLVFCSLLAVGEMPAEAAESRIDLAQVRKTIERSIPYIERQGVWWLEEKGCVSCHRISFMVWSLNEARRVGVEVDEGKLQEWTDWSVTQSLAKREEDDDLVGSRNLEGVAQMLLGAFGPSEIEEEVRQKFVRLIAEGQQPDGLWKPGGQLPGQKRPADETAEVSAMWNVLALASAADADGNVQAVVDRTLAALKDAEVGQSTEWLAVRLLVELRLGEKTRAGELVELLRARQHADGGWGWISDEASDALATGQAIHALSEVGLAADDPVLARAARFLVESQREDGSWQVPGTKKSHRGKPQETSNYWGTTWAVIGLSRFFSE